MRVTRYFVIGFAILLVVAFVVSCNQERFWFFPEKLPGNYKFSFKNSFHEISIPVDNNTTLNGLLFKSKASKGLVFYLHGNGSSNRSWGEIADEFLSNHYDLFLIDYRGYGKSQGKIESEKQFMNDVTQAFDYIKELYKARKIIIIGYSMGTGPATYLASIRNPKLLILQAPYYNMPDLARKYVPLVPSFIVRYKFETDKYIQQVKCPIVIFHGDEDEIIYTGSSYKLQKYFKPGDKLFVLKGQKHGGINRNPVFVKELKKLLL